MKNSENQGVPLSPDVEPETAAAVRRIGPAAVESREDRLSKTQASTKAQPARIGSIFPASKGGRSQPGRV